MEIEEKKKQIEVEEKRLKEKYNISEISELEQKKEELEKELETCLSELKNLIQECDLA